MGMACSFPGVEGPREFWSELSGQPGTHTNNEKSWRAKGFDHSFFNLTQEQADGIDPQQRQLLQETWRCIEDAGAPLSELQEKDTAVFVGVKGRDSASYDDHMYSASDQYHAIVANRIAYAFHFKSKRNNMDSICPTSLMAVHRARVALLAEKCDYALAIGGSWDMHTGPSEDPEQGVAVLLLQPLMKALAGGHHIYGIIRGSHISLTGGEESADQENAWESLLASAHRESGFTPQSLTYMEVQGVKYNVGDTYNLKTLDHAFRQASSQKGFCRMGAQKTHIGQNESSAGIAGIIKILMMMRHQQIPASVDLNWTLEDSPLRSGVDQEPWPSVDGQPLRAGISSFGVGGIQAHAIIESFSPKTCMVEHLDENHGLPFILSAKTPEALNRLIEKWKRFVQTEEFSKMSLSDACATLMIGRQTMAYRFGVYVKSREELVEKLQTAGPPRTAQSDWGIRIHNLPWDGMIQLQPVINQHARFERVLSRLVRQLNLDTHQFNQPVWEEAHGDLFKVVAGYAYLVSMTDLGFKPSWLTGQGVGSWVALAASGMLSIKEVAAFLKGELPLASLELTRPRLPFYNAVTRCKFMPFTINETYLKSLIETLKVSRAELCRYLGKARLLKSSLKSFRTAMEEWERALVRGGVSWNLSQGDVLGKGSDRDRLLLLLIIKSSLGEMKARYSLPPSRHLKDIRFQELLDLLADGILTQDLLVSLLTGATNEDAVAAEMDKRQHLLDGKRPYYLLWESCRTLHEIANHGDWLTQLSKEQGSWSPLDKENVVEVGLPKCASGEKRLCVTSAKCLASIVLDLWERGIEIQWPKLYPSTTLQMVSLPCYPFAGPRLEDKVSGSAEVVVSVTPLSLVCTANDEVIRDSRILGVNSLPPSRMVELSVKALNETGTSFKALQNISFHQPSRISDRDEFTVSITDAEKNVGLFSKESGLLFETGYINDTLELRPFKGLMGGGILQTVNIYENLARSGYDFGPGSQLIQKVHGSPSNLFFNVQLPSVGSSLQSILCACFQAPLIIRFLSGALRPNTLYGPHFIKELHFNQDFPKQCIIRMEPARINPESGKLCTNISVYNQVGQSVLEMVDLVFGEFLDTGASYEDSQKVSPLSCLVN